MTPAEKTELLRLGAEVQDATRRALLAEQALQRAVYEFQNFLDNVGREACTRCGRELIPGKEHRCDDAVGDQAA